MVMFSETKESKGELTMQFAELISLFVFGRDACVFFLIIIIYCCGWLTCIASGVCPITVFTKHIPASFQRPPHMKSQRQFWRQIISNQSPLPNLYVLFLFSIPNINCANSISSPTPPYSNPLVSVSLIFSPHLQWQSPIGAMAYKSNPIKLQINSDILV